LRGFSRSGSAAVFVALEHSSSISPSMAAKTRRNCRCLADDAVLLIAREIDDVTPWRYDLLNHGCPPA
jgi:hypothetical protein